MCCATRSCDDNTQFAVLGTGDKKYEDTFDEEDDDFIDEENNLEKENKSVKNSGNLQVSLFGRAVIVL